MNNPNTIENQVLTILKENTDARNDDMKLYLLVCNRCYQRYENQDIGGLPFAVIMNCYTAFRECQEVTSKASGFTPRTCAKSRSSERTKAL